MKVSLFWVLLVPTAAFAVRFNNPTSFTGGAININGNNKGFLGGRQPTAAPATEELYLDEVSNDEEPPSMTLTEVVEPVSAPSQNSLINLGCILAANSGFINGLALSGLLASRPQAVAAVTGAYTTAALASGTGKLFKLPFQLIVAYMAGSGLNGVMNPRGIDWSKKPTALLLAGVLVLVGALDYIATDRFFILLTMAMGLQNSWTSMLLPGNVLRTAHISGMTSDMGTILGQSFKGNTENMWKFKVWFKLAASFFTGGYFSVLAATKYTEVSFLGPVALYFGLFLGLSARGNPKPVVVEAPVEVEEDFNVTLDVVDGNDALRKKEL
jgi:uncharacterized membrane protein YoaK (UPF0700 family)